MRESLLSSFAAARVVVVDSAAGEYRDVLIGLAQRIDVERLEDSRSCRDHLAEDSVAALAVVRSGPSQQGGDMGYRHITRQERGKPPEGCLGGREVRVVPLYRDIQFEDDMEPGTALAYFRRGQGQSAEPGDDLVRTFDDVLEIDVDAELRDRRDGVFRSTKGAVDQGADALVNTAAGLILLVGEDIGGRGVAGKAFMGNTRETGIR